MVSQNDRSEEIEAWIEKIQRIEADLIAGEEARAQVEADRAEAAEWRKSKREAAKRFETERLMGAARRAKIAARVLLTREQMKAKKFGGAVLDAGTLNPVDLRFLSNSTNVNSNGMKAEAAKILLAARQKSILSEGKNRGLTRALTTREELAFWYKNLGKSADGRDLECLIAGDRAWHEEMTRLAYAESERRRIQREDRRDWLEFEMNHAKAQMDQAAWFWYKQIERIADMTYDEMVAHDQAVQRAENAFLRTKGIHDQARARYIREIGTTL